MFNKGTKSTFKYWFAHWCAFQMTALNLGVWKFKYLLHDIEKPWLYLIVSYQTLHDFHCKHNKHHIEYTGGVTKLDYEAMVIDWECARLTKTACPRTAREMYEPIMEQIISKYSTRDAEFFSENLLKTYKYLNL